MANPRIIKQPAHINQLGVNDYPIAKAEEVTISGIMITGLSLEGELGIDGATAGRLLKKDRYSITQWLKSNSPLAKPFKGMVFKKVVVEGNNTPLLMIPPAVVAAWLTHWITKKDPQALALNIANNAEVIESRIRDAFHVEQLTIEQKEQQSESLRLWFVEKMIKDYPNRKTNGFHIEASDIEKELVFANISIKNWEEQLEMPLTHQEKERCRREIASNKQRVSEIMSKCSA